MKIFIKAFFRLSGLDLAYFSNENLTNQVTFLVIKMKYDDYFDRSVGYTQLNLH